MASRDHLRRTTSTPPPGGYGGDGSGDDQSRTSEVTGDQGRAARDESDESVSPRARELYCTEEWVGKLPRLLYPDGDLCVYDDERGRRFVIIRKLTLSGGVGRKCVVTYATDRYDPDDIADKEAVSHFFPRLLFAVGKQPASVLDVSTDNDRVVFERRKLPGARSIFSPA